MQSWHPCSLTTTMASSSLQLTVDFVWLRKIHLYWLFLCVSPIRSSHEVVKHFKVKQSKAMIQFGELLLSFRFMQGLRIAKCRKLRKYVRTHTHIHILTDCDQCACLCCVASIGCNFGFLINVKMCDRRRLRDSRRMRERDFQNRMGTI